MLKFRYYETKYFKRPSDFFGKIFWRYYLLFQNLEVFLEYLKFSNLNNNAGVFFWPSQNIGTLSKLSKIVLGNKEDSMIEIISNPVRQFNDWCVRCIPKCIKLLIQNDNNRSASKQNNPFWLTHQFNKL